MTYEYLTLDTDDGVPVLRASTFGCGCCSSMDYLTTKAGALDALKDVEERLKRELAEVAKTRRAVRKWKS